MAEWFGLDIAPCARDGRDLLGGGVFKLRRVKEKSGLEQNKGCTGQQDGLYGFIPLMDSTFNEKIFPVMKKINNLTRLLA